MRNIYIPETAEAYKDDVLNRAFPDTTIADNRFYRGLIDWVCETRTPILYEQTHDDEHANFSINFNWLLVRDYQDTAYGHPDTIKTMYGVHEFAHMTHRLPVNLDGITAEQYAEDFTHSEYRASNETEILIHYRIPVLRTMVFQGTKTIIDLLRERKVPQHSSATLARLRETIIEADDLDQCFTTPEDQAILGRLKSYNGNRPWACQRYNTLKPVLTGLNLTESSGISDHEYDTLPNYEPHLDQQTYEDHMVRNVKLGYAMCGLAIPSITTLRDAIHAVADLEERHAII